MQGTLENAILAGADMMQGDGMQDALLQQNWEKTQYRAADWLSDWAAQKGRRDAEDWKSSQKKEGILGLAWLGLSRAGSMLSSAWDGVSELFNPIVDAMFKVSFGMYDCNNFNCIFNSVNYTVIVMYNLTDRIII